VDLDEVVAAVVKVTHCLSIAFNSHPARPLLPAMKDADELQTFSSDAVRDDIGDANNNQFSCTDNSARPAHLGLSCEQINVIEDTFND
jgi:hypothetical protein